MTVPVPEIFYSPQSAISKLKNSFGITNAILIQLSSWLSLIAGFFLLCGKETSLGWFIFVYAAGVLLFSAAKISSALLIHLFAEILGGEGKITKLLFLLCFADLPFHFLLPLGLLLKNASFLAAVPVILILWGWSAFLTVKTLQVNYNFLP